MSKFFFKNINFPYHIISGDDAKHILKSLRMKVGETLILCDGEFDYKCNIEKVEDGNIKARIIERDLCRTEPKLRVNLYQALTKGDKMDFIIQKSIESGVSRIIPMVTSRCISRPDKNALEKKIKRWQKISLEAAKQSGRGMVPEVSSVVSLEEAIEKCKENDCSIVFYEGGGEKISNIVHRDTIEVNIFIGPEGGFSEEEIEKMKRCGMKVGTMGPRILRAETAAIISVALVIYESERL